MLLAACSSGDAPSADKTIEQEAPEERGAVDIQRKADEAVKAKLEDFEAQAREPVASEPEVSGPEAPAPKVEGEQDNGQTKADGKK